MPKPPEFRFAFRKAKQPPEPPSGDVIADRARVAPARPVAARAHEHGGAAAGAIGVGRAIKASATNEMGTTIGVARQADDASAIEVVARDPGRSKAARFEAAGAGRARPGEWIALARATERRWRHAT